MAGNDFIARLGQSAAATTPVGGTPAYGMAFDMASGQWVSAKQFDQFAENAAQTYRSPEIQAQAAIQSEHDHQLAVAQQFANGSYNITGDQHASLWHQITGNIGAAVHSFAGDARQAVSLIPIVGGWAGMAANSSTNAPSWNDYKSIPGALLTQKEYESLDPGTQAFMASYVRGGKRLSDAASTPGIHQALQATGLAYRGATTVQNQIENSAQALWHANQGDPLNVWFSKDRWSQAWKDSQDQSFGSALLNTILSPVARDDQLDEWAKHSSLYQMTAWGGELALGWEADPGVALGKGAGATTRLVRNETFLDESSTASRAMNATLQGRERILVKTPVGMVQRKIGEARANSFIAARPAIEDAISKMTDAQVTGHAPVPGASILTNNRITMFGGRTINGDGAAIALKRAVDISKQTGDRKLLDLTWGALHGDPAAYSEIRKLNVLDPEDVKTYDSSGQWASINDAIESTKTLAGNLQSQIEDMQNLATAQGSMPQSWNWVSDRDIASKQADLAAAQDKLARYEGYARWAQAAMPDVMGDSMAQPQLARVQIPKPVQRALGNPAAPKVPQRRFFLDNQFGTAHSFFYVPKAAMQGWKATTINAHDLSSGPRAFERNMTNLKNLFDYQDPNGEILNHYITQWHNAPNETERINTAAAFEHQVVMDAVTGFYNKGLAEGATPIDPDTVRAVYERVVKKQNEMMDGLGFGGQQTMYAPDSTQSLQQRTMVPGSGAQLVHVGDDTVRVNLQNEAGAWETYDIPKEQWVQKPLHNGETPLLETQTSNYYNPIDAWRFHAELQRDPEFLDTLNANLMAHGRAELARSADLIGTKFNRLWKPLTLFRLGWPMRVLMDEGVRGLAILGPINFTKYYGPGLGNLIANGLVKSIDYTEGFSRWLARRRQPQIGPGPLRTLSRRTPLGTPMPPAPRVPESFLPKPDPRALEGLFDQTARYRQWERDGAQGEAPVPAAVQALGKGSGPRFIRHDGKAATNGTFVPLTYTTTDLGAGEGALTRWLEQWATPLSDQHYSIGVNGNKVFLARRFTDNKFRDAADFHYFVNKDVPGSEMLSIGEGGKVTAHRYDPTADDTAILVSEIEKEWRPYTDADAKRIEQRIEQSTGTQDPLADFDNALDTKESWVRRQLQKRREIGQGYSTLVSSDGKKIQMPNAFEGHRGQVMYALTGSEKTIDQISEGHAAATSWMRGKAIGHKTYSPADFVGQDYTVPGSKAQAAAQEYFGRWADMVNDQLGNSQVAQRILRGQSDDEVARWLAQSTEGQRIIKQLGLEYENPALYTNQIRDLVNRYVPSYELQRRLVKGRLSVSDLRRHVADEDLPDVFGPEFERLDGAKSKTWSAFQGLVDKTWQVLGTTPIDALSRHPFYRANYDLKMRALIGNTESKWIDDNLKNLYEQQAHGFASEQVRRHLWDLTDHTNFAEATRFIFPFWAAQREALAKWAQITFDRPETVSRFLMGQRATYRNFVVVDQNGQPVGERGGGQYGTNYHPNDRVIVQIPKELSKIPFFGRALKEIGSIGIPIGSANTVMQGDYPTVPGAGPLVTIPVDKFLRWQSDTIGIPQDKNGLYAFLYNYLFPIGRPKQGGQGAQALDPLNMNDFWGGIVSEIAPSWAKRVQDTAPGLASYNNFMLIYRQMQQDAIDKGEDPNTVTIQDAKNVADRFSMMKIFTGMVAPFQIEYRPKDQFYLDQYHNYQRKYGPDADQKFLDQFGVQYAQYVTSSTKSPYGVPATAKGLAQAEANKGLLDKYGDHWGSFIISPDAWNSDFSYDAYAAETQLHVSPGSSQTLRQNQDPEERQKQADITAGWYEYRKLNSAIQAALAQRGLTNLNQAGAKDLDQLKQAVVKGTPGHEGLAQKYPAWYDAYMQGTTNIYVRMNQLKSLMKDMQNNQSFNARPDVQGMRQYLLIRQQVTDVLDALHRQGGSWNLQASQNAPLRDWFYNQVGTLMQENPAFSEVYTRYLESDTLQQGSGGLS